MIILFENGNSNILPVIVLFHSNSLKIYFYKWEHSYVCGILNGNKITPLGGCKNSATKRTNEEVLLNDVNDFTISY